MDSQPELEPADADALAPEVLEVLANTGGEIITPAESITPVIQMSDERDAPGEPMPSPDEILAELDAVRRAAFQNLMDGTPLTAEQAAVIVGL